MQKCFVRRANHAISAVDKQKEVISGMLPVTNNFQYSFCCCRTPCTVLEIKQLIYWNRIRITTLRISLNQLSFPNRCTLNRIGKRSGEAFIHQSTFRFKVNLQLHPGLCTPRRRDGPTEPFITRCFTIALCHQRDCLKSREWMCRLWLLVIKRRGVAINTGVSFMLSSVWSVCPAGHNDKMAFMWDFSLCWNLPGDGCSKTDQSCTDWAVFFEKLNSKMKTGLIFDLNN